VSNKRTHGVTRKEASVIAKKHSGVVQGESNAGLDIEFPIEPFMRDFIAECPVTWKFVSLPTADKPACVIAIATGDGTW